MLKNGKGKIIGDKILTKLEFFLKPLEYLNQLNNLENIRFKSLSFKDLTPVFSINNTLYPSDSNYFVN